MKIACWSGPRNISTAMMYSFANRADCGAVDEPFYAAYLAMTGRVHPMGEEILASQPTDPEAVISALTGANPGGLPHVYHKHMAQHMLPRIRRDWIGGMKHILLIRHHRLDYLLISLLLATFSFLRLLQMQGLMVMQYHGPLSSERILPGEI